MSTAVGALKSWVMNASKGLRKRENGLANALEDPAIRDVVVEMTKMSEGEKAFVLQAIDTLMRGKR